MTKPMLIDRLPCIFGIHKHVYDGVVWGPDGVQFVRTKCLFCDDVDYGTRIIDYRFERQTGERGSK